MKNRYMQSGLAMSTLLLISSNSVFATADLIKNGSFENYSINYDHGAWKEVEFDNWTGYGEVWNSQIGKEATQGNHKIELDAGKELNTLAQTVTTENRLQYAFSLDAYARTSDSSDFEIWVDDEKLETVIPTSDWDRYTFNFFGNGKQQSIQIKEIDSQNNTYGTVIDNISLVSTGEYDNRPPVITGLPAQNIAVYNAYQFTPTVSDEDNDTLTFSIINQPSWAIFDTTTGMMSGEPLPSDVGEYVDINITVNDGRVTAELTSFSIEVTKAIDIAQSFGEATQPPRNGYYYYGSPDRAIDGNGDTYNHTQGTEAQNWWQLEIPSPTKISKIMVQGRESNAWRLGDAGVYISDTPYNGTLDESKKVATLQGNSEQQTIELSEAKQGTYLIVKGKGSRHIHLSTVEVFGQMPGEPRFAEHESEYLINGRTSSGTIVATVNATDLQGDVLTYHIIGDVPFSIDAQGNISVNGLLTGEYNFTVQVSDGKNNINSAITIAATTATAVDDALALGSVDLVTEGELIQATLNEIEEMPSLFLDAKTKIFNLNPDGTAKSDDSSLTTIDWNPTHDASTFTSTLGKNTSILNTNAVYKTGKTVYNKELAIIGEKANARYLVMGANPLRVTGNEQMDKVMENALGWLSGRDNLKDAAFNVVIAQLDESYWFKDESKTRTWLDAHYPGQVNYNAMDACDEDALSSCLNNDTDLLIISQISQQDADLSNITSTVNQALEKGISVLYIHHDGNQKALGKALFSSVFNVRYEWDNYWKRLNIEAYNPTLDINTLPSTLVKVKSLFTHFLNNDYNFDWSLCDGQKCNEVIGLKTEFESGASVVKDMMTAFDVNKMNIFNEEGYRLQKLLALTADKFRQQVSYPMDKVSTNDTEFMKSYFADHTVYNYRNINPAQADMGNFSRSDFSHIEPITKTINIDSKKSFRSTGAYALPGETLTVTRNDNSDLTVKVFINSLRSGATHQYQKEGYKRPKYLQTPHFEIKAGETIELTSPYGGPIQLQFSKNDLPVSVTFERVGEHPYWNGEEDNTSFEQQLAASDYDWAEVVTPGFEIHSTLEKMRKSISDPKWGTAEALATATMRYMHNLPHALAGFQGPGIEPIAELHDFAKQHDWTINTLDKVKHMNADQATCGYGCSGNPYDAYWAYSPVGHGDVHELGHGLQGGKRFAGWENHSMTNYYSYYTKSQYFKDTGNEPSCQNLPFEANFNILQDSVNQPDAIAYVKENLWDKNKWNKSAAMFIQMMMAVQNDGALQDGWLLRARLHMFERELNRSIKSEAIWNEKRANLGMSHYSMTEAKAINNNDWYLIALSYSMERDFRDYLTMWAIPFSEKAATQVESLGYTLLPAQYFVSDSQAYCKGLDKPAIAIDGQQAW